MNFSFSSALRMTLGSCFEPPPQNEMTANEGKKVKRKKKSLQQSFFFYLTFSMSATGPKAGEAAERDRAQKPPLVESGHVSDCDPGLSAKSARKNWHPTLRARVPSERASMCARVCVSLRACVRGGDDFRLITAV